MNTDSDDVHVLNIVKLVLGFMKYSYMILNG